MADLAAKLIDAGLIQFGAFAVGERMAPYQLHLEYLPSYPDILAEITSSLAARLPPVDHLLCTADAVPIGVALGLRANLPLVYSRGSDGPAVSDLVGAYDIGHQAALVTTAITDAVSLRRLIDGARRVGLDTRQILAVIDVGVSFDGEPVESLFKLADVVAALADEGHLPPGQAAAVRDWLANRM